jgi:hypothetical protein
MVYTKTACQDKPRMLATVVVLITMTLAVRPATASAAPADSPHVRSTNSAILASLREGAQRSPTFSALIDAIDRSNGIVYVEFGYCAFGRLKGCLLPFIAPTQTVRYLRVVVTPDKARQDHDQWLALVAHELRHALEVLDRSEVKDLPAMEAMYRAIGTPIEGAQGGFETSAARAACDVVLDELSSQLQSKPLQNRTGTPPRNSQENPTRFPQ